MSVYTASSCTTRATSQCTAGFLVAFDVLQEVDYVVILRGVAEVVAITGFCFRTHVFVFTRATWFSGTRTTPWPQEQGAIAVL